MWCRPGGRLVSAPAKHQVGCCWHIMMSTQVNFYFNCFMLHYPTKETHSSVPRGRYGCKHALLAVYSKVLINKSACTCPLMHRCQPSMAWPRTGPSEAVPSMRLSLSFCLRRSAASWQRLACRQPLPGPGASGPAVWWPQARTWLQGWHSAGGEGKLTMQARQKAGTHCKVSACTHATVQAKCTSRHAI